MSIDTIEDERQPEISIETADPLTDEVGLLLRALDHQLDARCGPERNHGSPATRLAQSDVTFFLARRSGAPVGCAALQLEADRSAEVKRMYVTPEARGHGVGRRLLMMVELEARRAQVRLLRLETSPPLHEAISLYRRSGFVPCDAFGVYASEPINLYFEKFLE